MSCWVVPAVAADLWGVPVDHVLGRIAAGTLPSRVEHGHVLVDVHPEAGMCPPSRRRMRSRRLPTFSVLSEAEIDALNQPVQATPAGVLLSGLSVSEEALLGSDACAGATCMAPISSASFDDPSLHDEMGPAGDPDPEFDTPAPEEGPPLHWQTVRARVGRTRKPPGSF